MRSFIAAVVIGIIIIYTSSVFSDKVENITASLSDKNNALYTQLENKNKEDALNSLEESEKEFHKNKVLFEATSDHEELLRIEVQYSAIREFLKEEQFGDALASCAEIELLLKHLPGNFEVKAENIL